jgi:hypothetical protein
VDYAKAGYPHIRLLVPADVSRYGVAILRNTVGDHFFIGCTASKVCERSVAHVMWNGEQPMKTFNCVNCETAYTVKVADLSHLYSKPAQGRPLDRWVAGWLGYDTDDVQVSIRP